MHEYRNEKLHFLDVFPVVDGVFAEALWCKLPVLLLQRVVANFGVTEIRDWAKYTRTREAEGAHALRVSCIFRVSCDTYVSPLSDFPPKLETSCSLTLKATPTIVLAFPRGL